jgi:ATP-dependent DNA helicase RecQ
VREEIIARLGLRDPFVQISGFDRPNLHFSVERFFDDADKDAALVERVAGYAKPGIVYTATRRDAERIADLVAAAGPRAAAYHAGLSRAEREAAQNAFMDDELDVIVATTAFGMGVDKPNVRFVLHHAIPESVDAFWQEVGRAGRDGEPSATLLLYRPEDLGLRRFFAAAGKVDVAEIAEVAAALREAGGPVDPGAIQVRLELSASKLMTAVGRLEEAGAVAVRPDGLIEPSGALDKAAVEEAASIQADREDFDRSRVDMMRAYAELSDACRREFLLSYFGEVSDPPTPCGNCDVCDAGNAQPAPADAPFAVGARVVHPKWGAATVQRYEDDKLVALFDDVGYKALSLEVIAASDLLKPA